MFVGTRVPGFEHEYGNSIPSTARLSKVLPVSREFSPDNNNDGDPANRRTSSVPVSAIAQSLILTNISSYAVCIALIYATIYLGQSSAQSNFGVSSTGYDCSSNMICLQKAHVYSTENDTNSRIQDGRLSLLLEGTYASNSGVAYYNESVRFRDVLTSQTASFNTSFVIDKVQTGCQGGGNGTGDGVAFVISADNTDAGDPGEFLGIFHGPNGLTPYSSIVVEFDSFFNAAFPEFDISDNHVSFDFSNMTYLAAANASAVGLSLGDESTIYAWVEYSHQTLQLEVRVSNVSTRPVSSLLKYTVEIFDFVEEAMWVGFSAGSGECYNNYYIGDWTFHSYGLAASNAAPNSSLAPAPSLAPTNGKSIEDTIAKKLGVILGITVGIPALLLACTLIGILLFVRSGGRGKLWGVTFMREETVMQVQGMPQRFSYKQLSVATKGFSKNSKLGQGGSGSVYGGVLSSSGIQVAVKKITNTSTQGEKEFMAELSVINQLRHRHLIQLLGWCTDAHKGDYLLVYELMPNGSLDKLLFAPPQKRLHSLSWEQRFNIVTETAAAVDYLHEGWTQRVIHRDIKASNIMLDKDWNAKLGDFGLARLRDHEKDASTTVVAGTYGYIAPEVPITSRFTEKSDVYAFGVVVLEVACGRKSLAIRFPEDEMLLVDWVWQSLSEGDLLRTVDKRLEEYDSHWMVVMLTIGLLCAHPDPEARPSMKQVVRVLAGDAPVPLIPSSKPKPVFT